MPGGKNNTQRIETLESQAANTAARLNVLDTQIEGIQGTLKKDTDATEGHTSRITIVEQQLIVLGDLKGALAAIASIEKELVAIRKDIDAIHQWKDEMKKERDESARRFWAFGPNITAALISGLIALLGIALTFTLNFLLKPH